MKVTEHRNGFELRRYPAHLVAEIEVAGSFDEAPNRAFRPLASYINGANRSRRRIVRTAPVTQQADQEKIAMTAPVLQQAAGQPGRYLMQFVMPSHLTAETLPAPARCPSANAGDPAAAGSSRAILRPVDASAARPVYWPALAIARSSLSPGGM